MDLRLMFLAASSSEPETGIFEKGEERKIRRSRNAV